MTSEITRPGRDRAAAGAQSSDSRPGGTGVRPASREYRADLDGVRGVAIALVVVFHVWFGRVSGGVDVFLVLSGFFFTGLLLRRAESQPSVGVLFTLRRTARRLLPALVLVLAGVAVAGIAMRPYTQWTDLASQILASLFYYQNWHLALSWSDYLAADPTVSPLQHLWSMAVQGQFYLAATVLVATLAWIFRRARRGAALFPALTAVVLAVVVASFAYAAHGAVTKQGWNYYDSFARSWELFGGAALALLVPYVVLPRTLRIVLAWVGTAGVVLSGWLILDGANRYPGPAALLPVLAAVALILSGANLAAEERPWPNRILAARSARWLGDIAYSLYLWHWPILIFYLAGRNEPHASLRAGTAVIAVSVVLAWATHRWVEEPLRLRTGPQAGTTTRAVRYRRTAGVLVSVIAVAVATAAGGWQIAMANWQSKQQVAALAPAMYPGAEALAFGAPTPEGKMRPTALEAPNDVPPPTADGCIADWDNREIVTCTYGDPNATRTLALVGNSHVEHWIPALQVLAEQHSFRIQVYLKMGCPLTLVDDAFYKGEANPDCRDWSRAVIDRVAADHPDWVFTTGTRPRGDVGDETPQDYVDVWSAMADRGLNVITIRDTPWLRHDGVLHNAPDCMAAGGDPISCGVPRAEALDPVDPELEPASRFPNVFPIDLTDAFCDPEVCPAVGGNVLVYHDEHHLSASYSRSAAAPLGEKLNPILDWW